MRKKTIPLINLDGFKIIDEDADAVYLSINEITQILRADLSMHPHLQKYQVLFVFGSLTRLRFSDFSIIEPEDVRDRMLYKKQNKSDSCVVVPLKEQAHNIFVNSFNRTIPEISNPKFNKYIKEVA